MAFEGLINEVDCIDNVEAGLSERADGALISRGRISDDRTHVAVVKMYFVPNSRTTAGPSPPTRHLDFSYREIDSCRHSVSAHLNCMLWKVTPAIPLNPADRNAFATRYT